MTRLRVILPAQQIFTFKFEFIPEGWGGWEYFVANPARVAQTHLVSNRTVRTSAAVTHISNRPLNTFGPTEKSLNIHLRNSCLGFSKK